MDKVSFLKINIMLAIKILIKLCNNIEIKFKKNNVKKEQKIEFTMIIFI